MIQNQVIQKINRSEWKFLVPEHQKNALLSALRFYGQRDSHTDNEGKYQVTSLYYDTSDRVCYEAKRAGISSRFKLRWRWYGQNAQTAQLELKAKNNDLLTKTIQTFALSDLENFLSFPASLNELLDPSLKLRWNSLIFNPVLYTFYQRYAFTLSSFRLTVDENLYFSAYGGRTKYSPQRSQARDVILEVKGTEEFSLPVKRILSDFNLKQISFSKYEKGIMEIYHA